MKIEDQVTNLELSIKLKDMGVEQNGIHDWLRSWHNKPYILDQGGTSETLDKKAWYSAFTVAELGEMLPNRSVDLEVRGYKQDNAYWMELIMDADCIYFIGGEEREVDARAKMLIYLIENKLIPLAKA